MTNCHAKPTSTKRVVRNLTHTNHSASNASPSECAKTLSICASQILHSTPLSHGSVWTDGFAALFSTTILRGWLGSYIQDLA